MNTNPNESQDFPRKANQDYFDKLPDEIEAAYERVGNYSQEKLDRLEKLARSLIKIDREEFE